MVVLVSYLKWRQEVGKMLKEYNPTGFAKQIFGDRYTIHEGETFPQASQRVAEYIASAEHGDKRIKYSKAFYMVLSTNRFSPGGRIWRGAGRPRGQMLNCFVSPAEDSREGWGDLLRSVTIISGTGGGVGINFSTIRPRGTPIRGTGGEATGAVSLMKMINSVCNELREGGGRRSALMFCLNWDHPDLPEFLEAKLDKNELNNANVSVCIDETFLKLLDEQKEVILRWQGEDRGRILAQDIWDKIIANAWKGGDPGLLNIGLANKMNTIDYVADLVSTNPCGEIWMSPHDCCCLGAVNLSTHVINGEIDWHMLEETVAIGVRFLDNVLDQNHYPMPIIQETCHKHRRIGLGVMGLHDMLLQLGKKYDSKISYEIVDEVMAFIKKHAYETSIILSAEKGPFQAFDPEKHIKSGFAKKCLTQSIKRKILEHGIRNCALLTIAPTGTTAIIGGCSSGVEPLFQLVYKRNFNKHNKKQNDQRENNNEVVVHPLVKEFLKANKSTKHFQSAHDIPPENHLKMQQVCQRHIDNSISKTINLPKEFSISELSSVVRAYVEDLKGITIYRDGSKGESPLVPLSIEEAKKHLHDITTSLSSSEECATGSCDI